MGANPRMGQLPFLRATRTLRQERSLLLPPRKRCLYVWYTSPTPTGPARETLAPWRRPASATAVGNLASFSAVRQRNTLTAIPPPAPLPTSLAAVFADLNLDVRAGSIVTACLCMLAACVAVAAIACLEKLGPAVTFISFLSFSSIVPLSLTFERANEAGGFPEDPTAACQHPVIASYFGADFGGVAAEFSIWTRATYVISLVWCVLSTPLLAWLSFDMVKSGG